MVRRLFGFLVSSSLCLACGAPGPDPTVATVPSSDRDAGERPTVASSEPIPTAIPSASTAPPSASSSPTAKPESDSPSAPMKGKTYAFVVSFISPGDGTDQAAYERLLGLVKAAPKPLHWALGHWGKEGEHDACFDLSELSKAEKTAFVAAVKKEVGKSPKVQIHDSAVCNSR